MGKEYKLPRDFFGLVIDRDILFDRKLTAIEKLFLAEIFLYYKKYGCCYASNNYFAWFFGLSPNYCSEVINNLKKKNYISISYKKNGKAITKRKILFIVDYSYKE